jgi:UDP:flavonoid glycosyltransferase YjiC (YdhE family)
VLYKRGVDTTLPADWARWLTQHDEIVYFSMGSVALLTEDALKSIFRTLMDKTVIFALPKSQHDLARSFVPEESKWLLSTWAPQKQILAHPNVKLFISHCGMGGAQEGLLAHVPLLCIPQVRSGTT